MSVVESLQAGDGQEAFGAPSLEDLTLVAKTQAERTVQEFNEFVHGRGRNTRGPKPTFFAYFVLDDPMHAMWLQAVAEEIGMYPHASDPNMLATVGGVELYAASSYYPAEDGQEPVAYDLRISSEPIPHQQATGVVEA